jgi:predicted RNA-binding Zn ribbon-like protein
MPFTKAYSGPLRARLVDVEPSERSFRVGTGRICLDLIATVGERWGRCFERLRTPEDLADWLTVTQLVDRPNAAMVSAEHLDAGRDLRASVYSCLDAVGDGRPLPRTAVSRLNAVVGLPTPIPQLGVTASLRLLTDQPIEAALSVIARDAVYLIGGDEVARVKECAAPDCALIFFDHSEPQNRRWCSMSGCGNRAKVRAHRARNARRSTARA